MTAVIDQFRAATWRGALSLLCSLLFIVSMLGRVVPRQKPRSCPIYSLSFWHYYLYWLAYYFGAVPLDVFKRDAILMKAASLVALGSVLYLAAPWDLASLIVVAAGFFVKLRRCPSSSRDGPNVPTALRWPTSRRAQINTFPYSWISHPMLVGNIAAFGGTLINADFRRQWWPLACAHVALNLGLLVMELAVTPQRLGGRRAAIHATDSIVSRSTLTRCCVAVLGAALAVTVTLGFSKMWSTTTLLATTTGLCISVYAYAMYRCYSSPGFLTDHPRNIQRKDTRWVKHWSCRR